MNRKGFTLIEIIMVILIMAILMLILIPNVFVLVNKNKEKSCFNLIDNIESAAKIYVINNKYDLGFNCGVIKKITLQTLVNSGDLKTDSAGRIVNPLDGEILYDSITANKVIIDVTYNCDNKIFTYVVNGFDCIK